tara:strand:- start:273 stop:377 length:105 start_codon:yes stop_codon:yes gene_type:complete
VRDFLNHWPTFLLLAALVFVVIADKNPRLARLIF